ncbi:LytR/AlgR family response regulator transcription factor [Arcticibacterium luteifluviistationis]|uniref:DNA-binding response regulator n=1 Tax=Arcticibacterium luteifluviistationis TaxID=1784714 RepID=A0A2Z4GGE0_9BACT|nr:LytTR family DNA-binding domain-containing protein [Arcticibacterium luteifluviistationis]AWW00470.1 DNA-binding response regulator [Arcticibacterium luteifluviistationis]
MKLSSIIIEDSKIARVALERQCQGHKSIEHIASFEMASEALDFLAENEIDLIFLDVEMEGMNGFEFLNALAVLPAVIMTTSSKEYAYEAFQYSIVDYIQKPITKPRLNMAIEKVLEKWNTSEPQTSSYTVEESGEENIYVRIDRKFVRIRKPDISYIENLGDYVKIFTEKESYVMLGLLKNLEVKLGSSFFRVHRSYIVNLNKILDVDDNNLVVKDKVIPISRRQKTEFLQRLNIL